MNIVSIGIAAASVVTGLAGAAVAYDLATVDNPGTAASAPAAESQRDRAETRVRWKPCQSPAVREGRACVTDEVRLVQVGGAVGAVAAAGRPRDDVFVHDAFDDHGGDRDDSFDDDADDPNDFDDDYLEDHDEDSDDDSSGHGSGDDDDYGPGSGSDDNDDDDHSDDDDREDDDDSDDRDDD